MSNKPAVEKYMAAYNELDYSGVVDLLTDDVEWVCPGAFHRKGKQAFRDEMDNPYFEGKPVIVITRVTEENGVVLAEGTVRTKPKGQDPIMLMFCDVFEFRGGKISKLISYLGAIPG